MSYQNTWLYSLFLLLNKTAKGHVLLLMLRRVVELMWAPYHVQFAAWSWCSQRPSEVEAGWTQLVDFNLQKIHRLGTTQTAPAAKQMNIYVLHSNCSVSVSLMVNSMQVGRLFSHFACQHRHFTDIVCGKRGCQNTCWRDLGKIQTWKRGCLTGVCVDKQNSVPVSEAGQGKT